MQPSQHASVRWPPLGRGRNVALRLLLGGAALLFLAALVLWWRFGPGVFVDALGAVWTCL